MKIDFEVVNSILSAHFIGILWFALVVWMLVAHRNNLKSISESAVHRIGAGGGFRIGPIELTELNVSQAIESKPVSGKVTYRVRDPSDEGYSVEEIYSETCNVFLVHKLFPSTSDKNLYDVFIYLSAKKDKMGKISKVEYFFGEGFGDRIFTSSSRKKRFGILVSASGTHLLCYAKVHFEDNSGFSSVRTWRFVEFENGTLGQSSR